MAQSAFSRRDLIGADALPSEMLAAKPRQSFASPFHRIGFTAIVAAANETAVRMADLGEAIAAELIPISGGCTLSSCFGLWSGGAGVGECLRPPEKAPGVVLHVTVEAHDADRLYEALRAAAARHCNRMAVHATWVHCEITAEPSLAGHFRLHDQSPTKETR